MILALLAALKQLQREIGINRNADFEYAVQ